MKRHIVDSVYQCYMVAAAVWFIAEMFYGQLPGLALAILVIGPIPLGVIGGLLKHLGQYPQHP